MPISKIFHQRQKKIATEYLFEIVDDTPNHKHKNAQRTRSEKKVSAVVKNQRNS